MENWKPFFKEIDKQKTKEFKKIHLHTFHEPYYDKVDSKRVWCCDKHAQASKNRSKKPKKDHPWITGDKKYFASKK